ncbi:MAG: MFS transporter [Pseudomonadota bacterium]
MTQPENDDSLANVAPKLGVDAKFAYGVGQVAEGVKNATFSMFVLFYYNQVLQLPATLAGLALFIALLFDAITDPLAGSISDNWRSRWGRRHPFMYASAAPLGVTFFLLFLPPEGMSEFALFAWMTVFVVLTRASMTLYHVPHLALGAELSEDYTERTTIVSVRYFMNFVGYLVVYYLGFAVFFADTPEFPRGQFNIDAYAPFAAVLSVVMFATIIWSAWGTHSRIPYLPATEGDEKLLSFSEMFVRTFQEVWEALQNPSFAWAFGGTMVIFIMVGIDSALNLYMYEFFWGLSSNEKLVLTLLYPLGIMTGTALVPILHRYVDKRHGITIGITGWSACQIIPIFLRFFGLLPENGTTELAMILTIIKFIQGMAAAQSLVSFHSMIADIADQHELKTGKRQEGIFFAAGSFASKSTSGVGSFLAGIGLDLIDWPTGENIQTAADVPVVTLANLGLMYGPIVSGFAVVSVLLVIQCKMTRAEHTSVVAELAQRRAAQTQAS